jgi:hypothetical protein
MQTQSIEGKNENLRRDRLNILFNNAGMATRKQNDTQIVRCVVFES